MNNLRFSIHAAPRRAEVKVRPGSLVEIRDFNRDNQIRTVRVHSLGEKNGRPLFDYDVDATGYGSWAYLAEILRVVKE